MEDKQNKGILNTVKEFFTRKGYEPLEKKELSLSFYKRDLKTPLEYYQQYNLAKNIVEKPVEDCLRNGIIINELNSTTIESDLEKDDYYSIIKKAMIHSRLFGKCLLVVKTLGDMATYEQELKQSDEFEINGFFILNNFEIIEDNQKTIKHYSVSMFDANGIEIKTKIHPSRALLLVEENIGELSNKKLYLGVLNRESLKNSIEDWEESYQRFMYMLRTDGLGIYAVNGLNDGVAAGDFRNIQERVKLFSTHKDRVKTAVIDKEDLYNVTSLQMGYLESFINNLMIRISSESRIPIIVLFGVQPTGLANSGSTSLLEYQKFLETIQQKYVKILLNFYFLLKYKKSVDYTIESPETKSDIERVDLLYKVAQIDDLNIQNDIYTPDEARMRYGGKDVSIYIDIEKK
jgi:phage-related protein (TIGR01555 family)